MAYQNIAELPWLRPLAANRSYGFENAQGGDLRQTQAGDMEAGAAARLTPADPLAPATPADPPNDKRRVCC